MLKKLYSFIFLKWMGWTIHGRFPDIPKYLLVVAPHTSNWDFPMGVFVRKITGLKSAYIAKKELFVFPLGYFFKALGGVPVERKKNTNFVQSIAQLYNEREKFVITITPEGTRSYSAEWKTGYYFIAKEARVPIVYCGMDWKTKRVIIEQPKEIADTVEEEELQARTFFSRFEGKIPENGVRL